MGVDDDDRTNVRFLPLSKKLLKNVKKVLTLKLIMV